MVDPDGTMMSVSTLVAGDGPWLVTVTVSVIDDPADALAGPLSDTAKSAEAAVTVSL